MRQRQQLGLDNELFLSNLEMHKNDWRTERDFQDAGRETVARPEQTREEDAEARSAPERTSRQGLRSETDIGASIATGLGAGILLIFESFMDGLIAGKPAPKPAPREPDRPRVDPFEAVIAAGRERQRVEQEEADRDWRKKQRSDYGE